MSFEQAEIKDLGSPFMVSNWFSWMGSVFSLEFVQALRAVLPHTRAQDQWQKNHRWQNLTENIDNNF